MVQALLCLTCKAETCRTLMLESRIVCLLTPRLISPGTLLTILVLLDVDDIYGFQAGDRKVDLAFAAFHEDDTRCLFEITSNVTL